MRRQRENIIHHILDANEVLLAEIQSALIEAADD